MPRRRLRALSSPWPDRDLRSDQRKSCPDRPRYSMMRRTQLPHWRAAGHRWTRATQPASLNSARGAMSLAPPGRRLPPPQGRGRRGPSGRAFGLFRASGRFTAAPSLTGLVLAMHHYGPKTAMQGAGKAGGNVFPCIPESRFARMWVWASKVSSCIRPLALKTLAVFGPGRNGRPEPWPLFSRRQPANPRKRNGGERFSILSIATSMHAQKISGQPCAR